jgi:glycosyltransferase involved in cell wall biosynthesis
MAPPSQADAHKKVRVLLVDTNDAMGGVVRVHLNLLKSVDRTLFHMGAACLRRGQVLLAFRSIPDIDLLTLETGTKPVYLGQGFRAKLADAAGLPPLVFSVIRLAAYCMRNKVQVIHTSDKKRALALTYMVHRVTGTPFIYHIHDAFVDYGLNRRALNRAAAIVANSQDMKRDFIRYIGRDMERIEVIYNGLDPTVFRPGVLSTLPSELGLNERDILIGTASRLAPSKGQETFLRAAAIVAFHNDRVHFILAGDDAIFSDNQDYVPFLHKLTEELGLADRVYFLGYRHDMVNVYSGLDVVVNTAWREAFGMVVVEPLACGKVVVGTRSGGIPEIIRHKENGFLFPPRDHEALARILIELLDQPNLIQEIGQKARQTVLDRFTIQKQAQAVEDVYKRVAEKNT